MLPPRATSTPLGKFRPVSRQSDGGAPLLGATTTSATTTGGRATHLNALSHAPAAVAAATTATAAAAAAAAAATPAHTDIDRTLIVNLKADVNLLQAEIDARTGHGGILDLQHRLGALNWTPDPVATLHVAFALHTLLLEKVNELSRVCTAGDEVTTPTGGTLSKRSKVGSIVAFFHNVDRRAEIQQQQLPSPPQQQLLLPNTSAGGATVAGGGAPPDPTPRGEVKGPGASRSPSMGPRASSKQQQQQHVANDDDDGVCWTASANPAPDHGGNSSSGNHPTLLAADHLLDSELNAIYGGTTAATSGAPSRAPSSPLAVAPGGAAAAATTALEQSVLFLQRKIAVFTYLEKYIHELDALDAALKAAMHPALAAIGVDVASMASAIDAGLTRRLSIVRDGSFVASGSPLLAATVASTGSAVTNGSGKAKGEPRFDQTNAHLLANSVVGGVGPDGGVEPGHDPLHPAHSLSASRAAAELRQMKHLVAFQSAVLSTLADRVEQLKLDHSKELRDADAKLRAAEEALRQQAESFERERTFHNTRHERASNLLMFERSRMPTPQFGSRPLSRISIKPGTPLPVNQKWRGENSSLLLLPPSPSSSQQPQANTPAAASSGPAPVVLAPLRRENSALPLVPTQTRDVAGEAQREYLRVIANQSDIIKDLAKRAGVAAGSVAVAPQQLQQQPGGSSSGDDELT